MLYDDDFVLSLPEDAYEAILKILEVYLVKNDKESTIVEEAYETRDFLLALSEQYQLDMPDAIKELSSDHTKLNHAFRYLEGVIQARAQKEQSDHNRQRFTSLLGKQFHYSLSDADVARIQRLLNELRDQISQSTKLEEDHRNRLLRRLERLQAELHKRISDLDRVYGLIGDAGVLVRKLGEDAKPIVDRIGEIYRIAWRSQANAEQLPSSSEPALQIEERSGSSE
jgi:hypothetical protein